MSVKMGHITALFLCLIILAFADLSSAKHRGKPNKYQSLVEQKPRRENRAPMQLIQKDTGCVCINYNCGCCFYMYVPEIDLNDSACVNVTYLDKDYGIRVTMTLDSWTILNETVSAKNPPPLCIDIPFVDEYADICIRLYNMSYDYPSLGGCIELEVRLYTIFLARFPLGCFWGDSLHLEGLSPPFRAPGKSSVFTRLRLLVRNFLVTKYRSQLQPLIYRLTAKSKTLRNVFAFITHSD